MNYALIKNSIVQNIIVWDGVAEFSVDGELIQIPENTLVSIGFIYQDGQFIDPTPVEESQPE